MGAVRAIANVMYEFVRQGDRRAQRFAKRPNTPSGARTGPPFINSRTRRSCYRLRAATDRDGADLREGPTAHELSDCRRDGRDGALQLRKKRVVAGYSVASLDDGHRQVSDEHLGVFFPDDELERQIECA
jgi:hypothetical protein